MLGMYTDPFPGSQIFRSSLQPPTGKAGEFGAGGLCCAVGAGPTELLDLASSANFSRTGNRMERISAFLIQCD